MIMKVSGKELIEYGRGANNERNHLHYILDILLP